MPSNTQPSSFFFFFHCFSTLFDYSLIKRLGLRMWHFLEELIMHHINLLALDKDAAVKIEVCINAASIWTAIIVINSHSGERVQLEDTSYYIFHSNDSRRIQCVFQQSFLSVSTDPFIRGGLSWSQTSGSCLALASGWIWVASLHGYFLVIPSKNILHNCTKQ